MRVGNDRVVSWASFLFDTGASHSFISVTLAERLGLSIELLSPPLCLDTPVGDEVRLTRVCRACEVRVADRPFLADLLVLGMTTFDVILGMDWLARYRAYIDCDRRRVIVSTGNTIVTCTLGSRSGVLLCSVVHAVEDASPSTQGRELPLSGVRFPRYLS